MNWQEVLIAAQLAQAAYTEDIAQATVLFAAMGFSTLGQYQNDDHQAYVIRDRYRQHWLAISGTRFGKSLGDLLDDIDIGPKDLGNGAEVSSGAYDGLSELWSWALNLVPPGASWKLSGHSLGAQRSQLAGLFISPEKIDAIYAFEAPKLGNAALWGQLEPSVTKFTCFVNGSDLWFGHPIISDWLHPPIDHIHLLDVGFEILHPGNYPLALNPEDHDIGVIVSKIEPIALLSK
jgi:hypothetical protein